MDKHKISISFKTERMYIYNYLKSTDGIKDNISAYICNLIDNDMQNTTTTSLEELVKSLVQQFIGDYTTNNTSLLIKSPPAEVLADEDINLINNLF